MRSCSLGYRSFGGTSCLLLQSSRLPWGAACFPEALLMIYQTARRHTSDDTTLNVSSFLSLLIQYWENKTMKWSKESRKKRNVSF
jgi:hypothetical protein